MQLSERLSLSLKTHLNWNKSRLDCFVGMLLGLIQLRQINLTELALSFSSDARIKSRYRRLQRFFSQVHFDYDAIARLIVQMFGLDQQFYYLTLDRTNWQWGDKDINILTLAIVYRGTAIPVYWMILNKRGNSNQRERIALLKRWIRVFGRQNLRGILGDREFIGGMWWQWLSENHIAFVMRMKESQLVARGTTGPRTAKKIFSNLGIGQQRTLRKACWVSHQRVFLSALRLHSQELLILASNRDWGREVFDTYALRWEIETLFQCLKGRGFHLERTRLIQYARIKKVLALLAIGFCWAHKTGEWKHKVVRALKIKKHGRLEQSLFRYGLDHLRDELLGASHEAVHTTRLWILFLLPPDFILLDNDGKVHLDL